MNFPLKQAILDSGLKQITLAKKTGLTPEQFSRIVHQHVEPTDEEKKAIAKALKRKVEELFAGVAA